MGSLVSFWYPPVLVIKYRPVLRRLQTSEYRTLQLDLPEYRDCMFLCILIQATQ